MPVGAARAGATRVKSAAFVPFDLISAVTPTTDSSNSLAVLASQANTWAAGDLLLSVVIGGHGNTVRSAATPAPVSWTPGTETWTQRFSDRGIVSTAAVSFNGYTATALSAETAKTATLGFNSTMFTLISALLVCGGSTIVRQVSPVAKVESTTTSVTATFGAAVLPTSQVVSIVGQRNGTTAFGVPTDFTEVFAQNVSTSLRGVVAARIGHSGTTVATTGMSSADVPKEAVAIELARPGQEL